MPSRRAVTEFSETASTSISRNDALELGEGARLGHARVGDLRPAEDASQRTVWFTVRAAEAIGGTPIAGPGRSLPTFSAQSLSLSRYVR